MDAFQTLIRAPLTPAMQRATQALCAAATPAAARAAAFELDAACLVAHSLDASRCAGGMPPEQSALTTALMSGGVSAATLAALLRSKETPRHAMFVSRLLFAAGLTEPTGRLRAKTLLSGGVLFDALLDAILAAAPVAAAGGTFEEKPDRFVNAAQTMETIALAPSNTGREMLNAHLYALALCLQAWPRTAQRLAGSPHRDAVPDIVLENYKPAARHKKEPPGDAPKLHGTCVVALMNVLAAGSRRLVWSPEQTPFRHRLLDALVEGLMAQVRASLFLHGASRLSQRFPRAGCCGLRAARRNAFCGS